MTNPSDNMAGPVLRQERDDRPRLRQHERCPGASLQGGRESLPLETAGGIQQVRFISEGDLYRLIVSSKLPAAQQFEAWVFDDVLPSIRRHGMYAIDELPNDDEFLERAIATQSKTHEYDEGKTRTHMYWTYSCAT